MNLSSLDLNLLRVLDALLREGSTVKAGARIGLSQPAVSSALNRLRHALGDELFLRRGQRIEPTDYARALEVPLRETLDSLEALLSGPSRFDAKTAEQNFKISGADFFSEMLMPQLGKRLADEAPLMTIQLVDLVPDSSVATLEKYVVDLALIPHTEFPNWVDSQPVFTSPYAVIARMDHPRIQRAELSPGDVVPIDLFCDLGHVVFSPEGHLAAVGDAALERVGRTRRVVMTMPFFSGVCGVVSSSDNIALMPWQMALTLAPRLRLNLFRPPMHIAPAELEMIWHRRASANPAHRWLRDLIAELLAPLDEMVPQQFGP